MEKPDFSVTAGVCAALLITSQSMAAPLSHLGQPIAEHVSLTYQGDTNSVCPSGGGIAARSFYRVWPSGERSSNKFRVPAKKDLVVTDVSWAAPWFISSTQPVVGQSALLKLAIHNSNGEHRIVSFVSNPVVITAENQSARIGTTEYMTSGFRVGPGKVLCASVDNRAAGFDAGTLDPSTIYVNGYLVDKF